MLKAFILDDEIKAIELLRKYINQIDFLELVSTSQSPLSAFNYIQANEVDVVFLDINMPVLTGIELYESLVVKPKLILTTGYQEYALEGYELDAVDYLLKPITFPRFLKACEKLHRIQQIDDAYPDQPQNMLSDIAYVKSGSITHKISWQEVDYLEKDDNYVIYHVQNKKILSRQTLTNLEPLFPSYFVRTHKSYAVSLLHITKVSSDQLHVAGNILPVGRSYRTALREKIKNHES